MKSYPSLFGRLACDRTSAYGSGKPCAEAEKVDYVFVDRRMTDDPMKNPYIGAAWYKKGRNHRVENGRIARDIDSKRWVVDIPDAAALQSFCEKHHPVILSIDEDCTEPCYSIEIYDSYRE